MEQICINCGNTFDASRADVQRGMGKFCSRKCMGLWRGSHGENTHTRAHGGRRPDLDNRYFRSSWEANWARYLNWLKALGQIREWDYECDTFEFSSVSRGNRSYTCDFKVVNNDGSVEYHEIKGYMDHDSRVKLSRMAKHFPFVKIIVVDKPQYRAIAKEMQRAIPEWE